MVQPDSSHAASPHPDRRTPRLPPRGQHPSLSPHNASPVASSAPEDFLGLDVEVQRSRASAQTAAPNPHLFAPPPAPVDTRVSTNTTLIPRSALFHPGQPQGAVQLPPVDAHFGPQRTPGQPPPPAQAPSLAHLMQPTRSESATARQAPAASNSWLLSLDDARSGRAGVEPVVHDPARRAPEVALPAQLDASFAEAPPVASRTVPWLVRGLIAAAAGSFLFVVGHTVLSPKRPESKTVAVPQVAPTRQPVETPPVLADPGTIHVSPAPETVTARANRNRPNKPVPMSPARPTLPPVVTTTPVRPEEPPPTFIEIPPPEFAPVIDPNATTPAVPNAPADPNARPTQQASAVDHALPPWYPGLVTSTPIARGEPAPSANELAGSPERKERVNRYLMRQSRGAAPLEDTSAEYVPPLNAASLIPIAPARRASKPASPAPRIAAQSPAPVAAVQRPGGVWEGAVVPVDQIASKEQILTPRVGVVRVTLTSGDVKEGRLHAVGQGQIWLDRERGPEGIARARIERLEQVGAFRDPLAYPGEKSAAQSKTPDVDQRVRVRTAGGLFYGKIVARDGDTLTLVTDDGARVTLEGGSVEPAPERKAVVKRESAPKPAPPKPVTPAPAGSDEDPDFDPDDPHGLHPKSNAPPGI